MNKKFNNEKIKAKIINGEYKGEMLNMLFAKSLDSLLNEEQIEDAKQIINLIKKDWIKKTRKGEYYHPKSSTPDIGMMSSIGYHVGHEKGRPKHIRRELLDLVISEELPPVGSEKYCKEWGDPMTVKRYKKLHDFLYYMSKKFKNSKNHNKAVSEWIEDIEYIEKQWKTKLTA